MTAHGLGAFVGWAGFAVMGLSFWVLAQVGFPLRRFGRALAEATWWLMVVGVAGDRRHDARLQVRRLVGLPLPAAVPQRRASGARLDGVLLHRLGAARRALDRDLVPRDPATPSLGPALHAVRRASRTGSASRSASATSAPKRFATNPRSVPYAVIPLTVIAHRHDHRDAAARGAARRDDRAVARPERHVDPLLAKNVLWFFGHPVVYLLLFPAVAVYYLLVPRYAGRPLVAGNIITVGWAIAVIANVDRLGAPHLPRLPVRLAAGGAQHGDAAADVLGDDRLGALALQPVLHDLPLAASRGTRPSTALFLGLVSWLLAGPLRASSTRRSPSTRSSTTRSGSSATSTRWRCSTSASSIFAADVRVAARARRQAALQRGDGEVARLADVRLRHRELGVWLIRGSTARRGASPCCRTATTLCRRRRAGIAIVLGAAQLLFVWNIVQTIRGKVAAAVDRSAAAAAVVAVKACSSGCSRRSVSRPASPAGWSSTHLSHERQRRRDADGDRAPRAHADHDGARELGGGDPVAGKRSSRRPAAAAATRSRRPARTGTVGPNLDETKPPLALVLAPRHAAARAGCRLQGPADAAADQGRRRVRRQSTSG